jgi:hypothetical protein
VSAGSSSARPAAAEGYSAPSSPTGTHSPCSAPEGLVARSSAGSERRPDPVLPATLLGDDPAGFGGDVTAALDGDAAA